MLYATSVNSCAAASGFEDPCGRVEYRTGPNGPLTQRSINRLGVRRIVFRERSNFTRVTGWWNKKRERLFCNQVLCR